MDFFFFCIEKHVRGFVTILHNLFSRRTGIDEQLRIARTLKNSSTKMVILFRIADCLQ